MKIFHLLNPSARYEGWVRFLMDSARPSLATNSQENSLTPTGSSQVLWQWVSKTHPDHTETIVEWAVKEGNQRIVVWGGDGTFHRAAKKLLAMAAEDKVELALVPVGTCNDLARQIRLDRYFWRQWEHPTPPGTLTSYTVWDMNGDIVVNNAGFGRSRSDFEKRSGPLGTLRGFRSTAAEITWPGGHLKGIYYMALACNAPYFSGGLHFDKTASPTDDLLDLYLVPATSKVRLGLRLLRGRIGLPLIDGKMTRLSVTGCTLKTDIPVWPQADGEPPPAEGVNEIVFSRLPKKIRLWAPL
ncbi:MAG TPA: diacylglycerol kinase family protein [Elusimicrobiota bacterium]|nr:diacylglycerol kinase family protein [Elusimicrobiota bacterium]